MRFADINPFRKEDTCNALDWSRFIGINLVVLGHFMLLYPYGMIVSFIFTFHMPLFFVISGMLHKIEDGSNRFKLLGKYFKSLIIPFFIYNLLGFIYFYLKVPKVYL